MIQKSRRVWIVCTVIVGTICCAGGYWFSQVRPFVKLDSALLVAPYQTIVAKTTGVISRCPSYPGKEVVNGEDLVVVAHEDVRQELIEVERSLEQEVVNLAGIRKDFDEGMKQYIEANVGGFELLEPALVAVQQAQMEIESVEARIKELQASKASLSSRLETKIVAPIHGVILKLFKQEGEEVKADEPICYLCHPSSFFVEASLPVGELERVQRGLSTLVWFPSFSKQTYEGKVVSVGPEVVGDHVDVRIEGKNFPSHPGLTAQVHIRVK